MIGDSYLNALGSLFDQMIVPSVPTLISGTMDEIIYLMLSPYGSKEYACMIETIIQEVRGDIRGGFYLILSPKGIQDVRDTCQLLLKERKK